MPVLEMPKLLTADEAAEVLGTTAGTLNVWRCTKAVKLPYVKVGRSVRYRMSDLMEFIDRNTRDGGKGK